MFALISTFSQAFGIILDKIILTRQKLNLKFYITILFFFLFFITAIFYPFLGKISADFFSTKYITLFIIMLAAAVIWNYYYYKGIEEEKIQKFELILMFQPLLTILLASLFLRGENNLTVEILAIVSAIALIGAQVKKHHFQVSSGSSSMFLAVIFMSVELIIIRILLYVISPVALYTIRTGIIFLIFFFVYQPHIQNISKENLYLVLATSALGTIQMVTKFYGFEVYGVVYTSLILILAPLIVYFASVFYFHEKLKLRTVVSALVILFCIVYATVLGR